MATRTDRLKGASLQVAAAASSTPVPEASQLNHLTNSTSDQPDLARDGKIEPDTVVSVKQGSDLRFRHYDSDIEPGRKDPYLRMAFTNIFVRDQDQSLQFFLNQLGFSLLADIRFASGDRWIGIAPPNGTGGLALRRPKPGSAEEQLVGIGGLISFVTEDVEAKYKEWSERGVSFTQTPQTDGSGRIVCRFQDPDGNSFELIGFDRLTRAIEEHRRELAERAEKERRATQELEIAKQVQARLFPQRLPAVRQLDYAGLCIQARQVGGDYFDFLDLGSEHVALVVGDVAGKGMPAALLMANLQANLRSQCAGAVDNPEPFLTSVNRQLFENSTVSSYATLSFFVYDSRSGRLRYANCGHLPALVLRRNGSTDRLDATCTVIGLFDDWQCSMSESQLNEGDILAIYTDGVTESFNAEEEEFGDLRLLDALRRYRDLTAQELATAIVNEVLRFSAGEQFDDITLIIAKRILVDTRAGQTQLDYSIGARDWKRS